MILPDNTGNFSTEIEKEFVRITNEAAVKDVEENLGVSYDIGKANIGRGATYRRKIEQNLLKPMNINTSTELIQVMGGIVGDAKLSNLGAIGFPDLSEDDKFFTCFTDRYSISRKFNLSAKEIIMNDRFEANETGLGYGINVLNNQINHASKAGFKQLITHASKSKDQNGYYTWLMLGYIPEANSGFEYYFNEAIKVSEFSDCKSYLELLSTEKGRDLWKEKGDVFDGVFDLDENSVSRQIFNKYLETRQIKKSDSGENDVFLYYFSEQELNSIFSSLTIDNLNNAYNKLQEHTAWKEDRSGELRKSIEDMIVLEDYDYTDLSKLQKEYNGIIKSDPTLEGTLVNISITDTAYQNKNS